MIIDNVDMPILITEYKILGDVHIATNRLGPGAATCGILYKVSDTEVFTHGVLYKGKLVAIKRYPYYTAVITRKGDKYKVPPWAVKYNGLQ